MHSDTVVVYLSAPATEMEQRIRGRQNISQAETHARIQNYAHWEGLKSQCDFVVDTGSQGSEQQVLRELEDLFKTAVSKNKTVKKDKLAINGGGEMKKTIIFDLGGVYFTDGTKNAVKTINENYGIDEQKVWDVFHGKIGYDYREGVISHDEYWRQAKQYWGRMDIPSQDLAMIWLDGYKPIEGTVQIIDELKKQQYPLYFLSDNVQERVDYLQEKYQFMDKFRDGVFSHIAKLRKPDPKIYQLALKTAKSLGSNSVYIDDKPSLLPPAQALGMAGIHFTSPQGLLWELEKLGVDLGAAKDRIL
jgi:putative hydrolase of the HAD superfamily